MFVLLINQKPKEASYMRNFRYILFVWCLLLGFSAASFAQFSSASNGPVPDIHKKATVPFVSAPTAGGDIAYGYGSISAVTLSMPMPAGTPFTTLAAFTFPNFGSTGVRGGDGNYYFLDYLTPTLYQFDPGSGTVTLIGNITGMGGANANGIAYDGTSSKYYLCGGIFGATNNLYELDITSRVATLVGSFPSPSGAMIDISINSSGVGYGYDLIDDMAYTFDPSTASTTLLGSLGYDANFGQGMDIDQATGTIYLSAFNNGTFTGQLRTMNPANGSTTLIVDWGFEQVAPFAINNDYGAPVGPGPATDPIPASGTTGVSINISDLMWTNPAGATSLEVYFGDTPGGMSLIYSGAIVNSVGVPGTPLTYSTTYYWKVNEIDGSGTSSGSTWNFTTEQNPAIANIFFDDFEAGSGNWTITNDGGNCVWEIIPLVSRPYTMPSSAAGNVFAADADLCGSGTVTNTTAVAGPFDATNATDVTLEFDNDWQAIAPGDFAIVDVSTDGGATWTNILTFDDTDVRNTHEFWPMSVVDGTNFWIRLVSIQPGWDWWWAIDNLLIQGVVIPVELTSFTAKANNNEVVLNWSTATETNNQGFDIERKSNGQFEKVGYVAGFGTTTEVKAYTFTDKTVGSGNYTYRLKQVDFNGTFEYSPEVEVEVSAPKVYQLSQNYPNPFNPATTINFSLAADSKVSLKIFDVIGQEVAQLVSGQLTAGQHTVNFDASSLNSGVYFYKIEANGVDGTSYSSVKKMILTK
jgi:hypothetical protein